MTDYDTLWRHNLETIRQLEEEYYSDDREYDAEVLLMENGQLKMI